MTTQQWNAYRGDALAKLLALELAVEILKEKYRGYVNFQQACAFTDLICSNKNMTLAAVRAGLIATEDESIEIDFTKEFYKSSYPRKEWHKRGTIYEAKLWEIYDTEGMDAAKGFFAATAVRAFTERNQIPKAKLQAA
jgi:hypothetical protein